MSEGEREEMKGAIFQGLEGLGEGLMSFYLEGGRSPGGLWGTGGAGPDSGALRRPLAAAGRTDYYIELCQPNFQVRNRLRKVSDLSRVTVTRGLSGPDPRAQVSLYAVSLGPRPSPGLPLCLCLCIFLCFGVSAAVPSLVSLSLSLYLSLSLPKSLTRACLRPWVAGWYLNADDNRPAHGQQLVVNSEDPIENWEVVGEKGTGR